MELSAYALHEDAALVLCRGRHGTRQSLRCLDERDLNCIYIHILTSVGRRVAPASGEPSEEKGHHDRACGRTTHVGVRRSLAYWNREFQRIDSPILRYGFSVVAVAIALGVAFALQHYQFRDVELPVLAVAIAFTTWYAGAGPSVLAVLLSSACFDYFFTEPLYSFEISTRDLPYFFIFVAWAAIVASFSAVRRRIEDSLRQTRDHLQVEVEQRRRREDEIRKLNQRARQAGCGTRSEQQGIGIVCLFRLPRPARAASPCGRVLGAAAKTGIFFARREESPVHTNNSRVGKKNG